MENTDSPNITDGSAPVARSRSFPKSPFPAWVPAVTVAVTMVIFLTISFYLRHRKVVKKRQILMDYFYVIFQYGGMRRKRMVTSLCNTNAITLRELGRSFMISCDSLTVDNSCPFYLEDSAFTKPRDSQRRPLVRKHSFFKTRGMTVTKKYRGPFIRLRADSEDQPRKYTSSFQDIVMKFRARRQQGENATSATRQNLLTPQFEGCSMSTIHGDEVQYASFIEENEAPVYYNRQRRNACFLQCDKTLPTFADVVAEAGKHSLGHSLSDRVKGQQSPYHGKRNSEPKHARPNLPGQRQGQQTDVFHVHGDMLSPSNVVCGSHGYLANFGENCPNFQSFRSSEPTIMVHSPSTDAESSQGWNDIRSKCTNGAVILKRVLKADGAPGEFYYEEKKTPALDRVTRASLSKVSYVPSGNMNEYYNCISPNKETQAKVESPMETTKGRNTASGSSRSKRGRLSIGNLAVSNFNRRIDIASDSLPECAPEHSSENQRSSDCTQSRTDSRTTWNRLKKVFSGSRGTDSLQDQAKGTKYLSVSDAHKTICQREGTRWQRFLSVFTGFRSLPETKKDDDFVDVPKTSNSYPMGLNLLASNENSSGLADMESNSETSTSENSQPKLSLCGKGRQLFTANSFTEKENEVNMKRIVDFRQYHKRPNTLDLRTLSLPEETTYRRLNYAGVQTMFEATKEVNKDTGLSSNIRTHKYRKHSNSFASPSMPLSKSKNYFKSYSFESDCPSYHRMYKFRQCAHFTDSEFRVATPARLEGNNDESEIPLSPRRVRSLSPLHETNMEDYNKEETCQMKSKTESVPDISVYVTPLDNGHAPNEECNFDIKYRDKLINSVDWLLQQGALFHNSSSPPSQSILHLTNFVSNESRDKLYPNKNADNLEGINYVIHAAPKQTFLDSVTCDSSVDLNRLTRSADKFPQTCYLTPEHRNVSCSTDSVYYDTVSALGTPSLCELTSIPDFTGLKSHWTFQDIPCVHLNKFNGRLETNTTLSSCDIKLQSDMAPQAPSVTNTSINNPDIPAAVTFNEFSPSLSLERENSQSFNSTLKISQTAHEEHPTATISVENLSIVHDMNECDWTDCNETFTNVSNCTPSMSWLESHSQSLPVPELKLQNKEYFTSSIESLRSSAPSTPTRRHSSPCPSPERALSRQSGERSPEEIYMANVARLPRMLQRASCYAALPNCVNHKVFGKYDGTNSIVKEN